MTESSSLSAAGTPILEVQGLEARYAGQRVLQVDNLQVYEGEVLTIIGPNGAGKSTLLLCLSALLAPGRGRVYFRGQLLGAGNELAYRRRIALVLQQPLLLNRSVFENVAMGLRFRGHPRAEIFTRVETWLSRLGIVHLKDRAAKKLSGGEAQRVSLARAFALEPDILLLDEPFSALDAPTRLQLMDDLRDLLAQTRITTLFVTHDLDEALLLGDRLMVLLEGRIRQQGKPQEVFTAPVDAQVAAFVGVETVVPARVTARERGLLRLDACGCQLEARGDFESGREVYFCLRPEDVTLWKDGQLPPSNAQNRVACRVQRIAPQGALVRVALECGFQLIALVTRSSVEEMALQPGQNVIAAFKVGAVHLIPRYP